MEFVKWIFPGPRKVVEKKKKSPKFGKVMKFVIFIVLNN